MESNTNSNNRAEAERWLSIAEKLLVSRDVIGSKTFAVRAREADPRLEYAEWIIVVADTLLAGDKRVNGQHDWYAILQLIGQTDDSELIATQSRRLALLLSPDRNGLPFADEAFRLVSEAWSVLSNPSRKALYDNELNLFPKLDPIQQQQLQQHQHHQQQQHTVRKSPRNTRISCEEKESTEDSEIHDGASNFWTACPYCYYMYEYPKVYEDCSLRCQNCRRAFHAVAIQTPPPISEGKQTYFCCWGFFPLGFSMPNLEKNKNGVSNWSPFSPIFACPRAGETKNVTAAKPKNASSNGRRSSAPRIYIDDDDEDVFVEVSESSEGSDDDWNSSRKKKKAKTAKGKGFAAKHYKKPQVERGKSVKGGHGEALPGGSGVPDCMGMQNDRSHETSRKTVSSNSKKQTGKVGTELGKLDLNVEFSNEVEEPVVPGLSERNGEEDGIEGIGFFEGLDEFLSSLPILSVVGDDKVKTS